PDLIDVDRADLFVRWSGDLGGADERKEIKGRAVSGWRHLGQRRDQDGGYRCAALAGSGHGQEHTLDPLAEPGRLLLVRSRYKSSYGVGHHLGVAQVCLDPRPVEAGDLILDTHATTLPRRTCDRPQYLVRICSSAAESAPTRVADRCTCRRV